MTFWARARDGLAGAGGTALGLTFRTASAVRPTLKPLHPRGRVRHGIWHRTGLAPALGVPLLDEGGALPVVLRTSRAVGLPPWLPDVHGLALRVPLEDGHADFLLASTGWGRVSRFVLTGGRDPGSRPLTTLLPYRSPAGPLVLGARLQDGGVSLACAVGTGPFRSLGHVVLGTDAGDPAVAFDPVRNQAPDLPVPDWVARLREPAYAGARDARTTATDPTEEP